MGFISRFTIQTYNIGIVGSKVLETGILGGDIRWLKHPYKDRFFADPFLWDRDEDYYYILVEEMCFFEEYGKITLLVVNKSDFSLKSKRTIIEKPFHLSFPFCKEKGDYIVPKASRSGKCVRYRISKDTLEIINEKTIANTGLVDPVIIQSKEGDECIHAGHLINPNGELFLYKKQENGLFELVNQHPVVIGKQISRLAGQLFEYKGCPMRPAQDCMERYGKETRIRKVVEITKRGLFDEDFIILTSKDNPPYDETMHTFNYYGDIALVDGSVDIFALSNVFHRFRKLIRRYLQRFKQRVCRTL